MQGLIGQIAQGKDAESVLQQVQDKADQAGS